jgi:hypothetical protein
MKETRLDDQLKEFVEKLKQAHGDNLRSVVLYGSVATNDSHAPDGPKNTLIVLDKIMPADLRAAHEVAQEWRMQANPLPVYFASSEVVDSSDVFPMEFIDMSRAHRVLYGEDPFQGLKVPTRNLRHQLEYELRGKLLRLRTLYIPSYENASRLARLMADSLDSFAVLFRHVLGILGIEAPFDKRDCATRLAEVLKLDGKVFAAIFDYETDGETWLMAKADEMFSSYLIQIERVVEAVNHLPTEAD